MASESNDISSTVVDEYSEDEAQAQFRRRRFEKTVRSRTDRSSLLRRTLLWSAGADTRVLEVIPSETQRFTALGALNICSGLVGTVSFYFSLTTVAQAVPPLTAAVAAAVFGFVLFSLDRFLLITSSSAGIATKSPRRLKRFSAGLAGVAIATLVGLVVAEPILLSIFDADVSAQLESEVLAKVKLQTEVGYGRLTVIDKQIARLQSELVSELSSDGQTGMPGNGVVARQLRSGIDQLMSQRSVLSRDVRNSIRNIAQPEGFLAREKALAKLSNSDTSLTAAIYITRALFVVLYALPALIALSLTSASSAYVRLKTLQTNSAFVAAERLESLRVEAEIRIAELRTRNELKILEQTHRHVD